MEHKNTDDKNNEKNIQQQQQQQQQQSQSTQVDPTLTKKIKKVDENENENDKNGKEEKKQDVNVLKARKDSKVSPQDHKKFEEAFKAAYIDNVNDTQASNIYRFEHNLIELARLKMGQDISNVSIQKCGLNEGDAGLLVTELIDRFYSIDEHIGKLQLENETLRRRPDVTMFDFDTSMSTSSTLKRPGKEDVILFYGWKPPIDRYTKKYDLNRSVHCMLANNNEHICHASFMNAKNYDVKVFLVHTVPIKVVDKMKGFKNILENPTDPSKTYKRKMDLESFSVVLTLCGRSKDLYDLGAILILPEDPARGKLPLKVYDAGGFDVKKVGKQFCTASADQIQKYVQDIVGLELWWPDQTKIPYIRCLVQHAQANWKGKTEASQALLTLCETTSTQGFEGSSQSNNVPATASSSIGNNENKENKENEENEENKNNENNENNGNNGNNGNKGNKGKNENESKMDEEAQKN